MGFQPALGLQLTLAVGGVGAGLVGLANLGIRLLFADGSHDTERRYVDEAAQRHPESQQGTDQMLRALSVNTVEVALVETLGDAGGMDHVVELVSLELAAQCLLRRQVQLDEMDALVGQELARAAAAHGRPRLEAPAERLFNNEGANKATGPGNQYLHLNRYAVAKNCYVSAAFSS